MLFFQIPFYRRNIHPSHFAKPQAVAGFFFHANLSNKSDLNLNRVFKTMRKNVMRLTVQFTQNSEPTLIFLSKVAEVLVRAEFRALLPTAVKHIHDC